MATKNESLYRMPHTAPRKVGTTFTEPSKTRPNGSLSLETLFKMHRAGQIVQPALQSIDNPKFVNYLCEMDDHDLTQLDAIRQKSSELYKKRSEQLAQLQSNVKVEDVVPPTE